MRINQIWNEETLREYGEQNEKKVKGDVFEAMLVFSNMALCFFLLYLLFL